MIVYVRYVEGQERQADLVVNIVHSIQPMGGFLVTVIGIVACHNLAKRIPKCCTTTTALHRCWARHVTLFIGYMHAGVIPKHPTRSFIEITGPPCQTSTDNVIPNPTLNDRCCVSLFKDQCHVRRVHPNAYGIGSRWFECPRSPQKETARSTTGTPSPLRTARYTSRPPLPALRSAFVRPHTHVDKSCNIDHIKQHPCKKIRLRISEHGVSRQLQKRIQ